jgi:hypothetical protein
MTASKDPRNNKGEAVADVSSPKIVMLIRNGEKPGDPTIDQGNEPGLSVVGTAQVGTLPSRFLPAARPVECALFSTRNCFSGGYSTIPKYEVETLRITQSVNKIGFVTPHFLFAAKDSSASSRPRQATTPTAAALGLAVNACYGIDFSRPSLGGRVPSSATVTSSIECCGSTIRADAISNNTARNCCSATKRPFRLFPGDSFTACWLAPGHGTDNSGSREVTSADCRLKSSSAAAEDGVA